MTTISIVMPVFNAMPYLPMAVESILLQSYMDFEFIILNDASTDDSAKYLDSLNDRRVRVIHCQKQGYVPLLNRGVEVAGGAYIARMDADDISAPSRLELQLRAFKENSELAICGCQVTVIDRDGVATGQFRYPESDAGIRLELTTQSSFAHPGVMLKRGVIEAAGGYDPQMMPAEDYDLWTRVAKVGRMRNLPDFLLEYRSHGNNISTQKADRGAEATRVIATRYSESLGIGADSEHVEEFMSARRAVHSTRLQHLTLAEGRAYCGYVQRFICNSLQSTAGVSDRDFGEVRRLIRWRFLDRAAFCPLLSRERLAWLRLAAQIDPTELRPLRIIGRKVSRVFCRRF